jgi:hypothetical protein
MNDPNFTCGDWTDTNPAIRGLFGRNEYLNFAWLNGSHGPCDMFLRLYCVEVARVVVNVEN